MVIRAGATPSPDNPLEHPAGRVLSAYRSEGARSHGLYVCRSAV